MFTHVKNLELIACLGEFRFQSNLSRYVMRNVSMIWQSGRDARLT